MQKRNWLALMMLVTMVGLGSSCARDEVTAIPQIRETPSLRQMVCETQAATTHFKSFEDYRKFYQHCLYFWFSLRDETEYSTVGGSVLTKAVVETGPLVLHSTMELIVHSTVNQETMTHESTDGPRMYWTGNYGLIMPDESLCGQSTQVEFHASYLAGGETVTRTINRTVNVSVPEEVFVQPAASGGVTYLIDDFIDLQNYPEYIAGGNYIRLRSFLPNGFVVENIELFCQVGGASWQLCAQGDYATLVDTQQHPLPTYPEALGCPGVLDVYLLFKVYGAHAIIQITGTETIWTRVTVLPPPDA